MATAIVTGASVRLGKAMACHLASRGFNIALHHHSSEPEDTKQEIEHQGVSCKTYRLDLSSLQEVEGWIAEVQKDFQDIELLINSAANFVQENVEQTQTSTLIKTMNLNLNAPYLLMRDYKHLIGRGMVINITDQRVMKNIPTFAAYSVAKVGLQHLTHLAAMEWGKTVRVNAIAPGLILPPPGGTEEYLKREGPKVPVGTHGMVKDILHALDYLLDSSFVNGETLFVDGGESRSSKQTLY